MVREVFTIRFTKEQRRILDARANSAGYAKLGDYIRTVLFLPMPVEEKIDRIYRKVVLNEED